MKGDDMSEQVNSSALSSLSSAISRLWKGEAEAQDDTDKTGESSSSTDMQAGDGKIGATDAGKTDDVELEGLASQLLAAGKSEEDVEKILRDPVRLEAYREALAMVKVDEQDDEPEDEEGEVVVDEEEDEQRGSVASGPSPEIIKALDALGDSLEEPVKEALAKVLIEATSKHEATKAEVKELRNVLGQIVSHVQRQEQISAFEFANKFFDQKAKELPELGLFAELPRKDGQLDFSSPQFKTREVIFNKAAMFVKAGESLQDALEDAYAWYVGRHGKRAVAKQIVERLKERAAKTSLPVADVKEGKEERPDPLQNLARAIAKLK